MVQARRRGWGEVHNHGSQLLRCDGHSQPWSASRDEGRGWPGIQLLLPGVRVRQLRVQVREGRWHPGVALERFRMGSAGCGHLRHGQRVQDGVGHRVGCHRCGRRKYSNFRYADHRERHHLQRGRDCAVLRARNRQHGQQRRCRGHRNEGSLHAQVFHGCR